MPFVRDHSPEAEWGYVGYMWVAVNAVSTHPIHPIQYLTAGSLVRIPRTRELLQQDVHKTRTAWFSAE